MSYEARVKIGYELAKISDNFEPREDDWSKTIDSSSDEDENETFKKLPARNVEIPHTNSLGKISSVHEAL